MPQKLVQPNNHAGCRKVEGNAMHYRVKRKNEPGGLSFRLIRALSIDDNVRRLRWHCAKLTRSMWKDPFMLKIRLKRNRRARATP